MKTETINNTTDNLDEILDAQVITNFADTDYAFILDADGNLKQVIPPRMPDLDTPTGVLAVLAVFGLDDISDLGTPPQWH
jgi:hypothetical protein